MKKANLLGVIGFVACIALLGGYLVMPGSGSLAVGNPSEKPTGVIEGTEIDLAFKMAGSLADLKVKEGDTVKAGQLLATLSNEELLAKREQAEAAYKLAASKLEQARKGVSVTDQSSSAQLDQAQAAVSAAKAQFAANKNGARPEEINSLKAKVQASQTAKDIAQSMLQRTKDLFTEGAVPQTKVEEAQAQFDKAQAELTAAQDQLKMAQSGARPEQLDATKAQLQQAEAAYQQAVAGRGQVGLRQVDVKSAEAGVQQAKGALDEVEAYLKNANLQAPIDGIVKSVTVQKGELVAQGLTVITLQAEADQFVKFYVNEYKLNAVKVGDKVKLFVPALSKEVDGEVAVVAPAADFAVKKATQELGDRDIRSFQVKVKVNARDLRPGLSVEWQLEGDGGRE